MRESPYGYGCNVWSFEWIVGRRWWICHHSCTDTVHRSQPTQHSRDIIDGDCASVYGELDQRGSYAKNSVVTGYPLCVGIDRYRPIGSANRCAYSGKTIATNFCMDLYLGFAALIDP